MSTIDDETVTVDSAFPVVETVVAAEGFRLLVHWGDGRQETVDIAPTVLAFKTYAPLRENRILFESVHVANPSVIAWGEDDAIDMHVSELERLAAEGMDGADFQAFLKDMDLSWTAAAALLGISRRMVGYYAKSSVVPRYIALACAHLIAQRRSAA